MVVATGIGDPCSVVLRAPGRASTVQVACVQAQRSQPHPHKHLRLPAQAERAGVSPALIEAANSRLVEIEENERLRAEEEERLRIEAEAAARKVRSTPHGIESARPMRGAGWVALV